MILDKADSGIMILWFYGNGFPVCYFLQDFGAIYLFDIGGLFSLHLFQLNLSFRFYYCCVAFGTSIFCSFFTSWVVHEKISLIGTKFCVHIWDSGI